MLGDNAKGKIIKIDGDILRLEQSLNDLELKKNSNEYDHTQYQHKEGENLIEPLQSNDGNSLTFTKDLRF